MLLLHMNIQQIVLFLPDRYIRVYAIANTVCLSSVMFVSPTQSIEIFAMFLHHFVP